jgi:hypothetical protein
MGKRLWTKGTASVVPKKNCSMRALAPEVPEVRFFDFSAELP